jgi:hypothetical protein
LLGGSEFLQEMVETPLYFCNIGALRLGAAAPAFPDPVLASIAPWHVIGDLSNMVSRRELY